MSAPVLLSPALASRARLRARLSAALHGAQVVALRGPAGVGKTWLVRAWTRELPPSVLAVHLDLGFHRSIGEVVTTLARALDLPLGKAPSVAEMLARLGRAASALRRTWVVLDQADGLRDEVVTVAEALAGGPVSVVVVVRTLPGVAWPVVQVDPLDEVEAAELGAALGVVAREGPVRPMTLRVRAGLQRSAPGEIGQPGQIAALPRADAVNEDLDEVLRRAVDELEAPGLDVLAAFAAFRRAVDVAELGAVADLDEERVLRAVDRLRGLGLVQVVGIGRRRTDLSLHPSVRELAGALAGDRSDASTLRLRAAEVILGPRARILRGSLGNDGAAMGRDALRDQPAVHDLLRDPDLPIELAVRAWLLLEMGLSAVVEAASSAADTRTLEARVAREGGPWHRAALGWRTAIRARRDGRLDEARTLLMNARSEAAKAGDPWLGAHIAFWLGRTAASRGLHDEARRWLRQAEARFRQVGDEGGVGWACFEPMLGTSSEVSRVAEALAWFRRADCSTGVARVHVLLSVELRKEGDVDGALRHLELAEAELARMPRGDRVAYSMIQLRAGLLTSLGRVEAARDAVMRGLAMVDVTDDRRSARYLRRTLVRLAHLDGDLQAAWSGYAPWLEQVGPIREDAKQVHCWFLELCVERGALAEGRAWMARSEAAARAPAAVGLLGLSGEFERSRALARELGQATVGRAADALVLERYTALVDVVEAERALDAGHLARARRGLERARPVARRPELEHHEDRIAHRVLVGRVVALRARLDAGALQEPLRVDVQGRAFQRPGGAVVDLGRRRAARRVLAALAEARATGVPSLSPREVHAAGWPERPAFDTAARNRLHNVVRDLRNLGLDGILLRVTGGGYALDPEVSLSRVDLRTTVTGPSRA